MAKIDSPGTYRGEITEATLGTTKKGYPQWVARLLATEKYIEEQADLDHFKNEGVIEEATPQWVDWSAFGEDILGYFVLFNDSENFEPGVTSLLNYEQIQLAVGWDGAEFESLQDETHIGKKVLFRVKEDDYNGQVKLKADWIDSYDASPTSELKKLDAGEVSKLTSKLKIKSKPAAAKPGKPAAAKSATKPASKPATAAPSESSKSSDEDQMSFEESVEKEQAEQEAASEQTSTQPSTPPSRGTKTQTPESTSTSGDGCTQAEAWEAICGAKGSHSDTEVEEAYIAGVDSVSTTKDEKEFTPEEWAAVRDFGIDKLNS